jgi:hypothetical protein
LAHLGLYGHSLMARRQSTIAFSSPSSSSSPLQPPSKSSPQLSPLQGFRTPPSPWPPRGTSRSVFLQHNHTPGAEDPDELFTKFTVSEVKQVHNRLLYAIVLLAFVFTLSPCATGLMQTPSKRSCGSWLGTWTYSTPRDFLELEYESAANGTAISCRRRPP